MAASWRWIPAPHGPASHGPASLERRSSSLSSGSSALPAPPGQAVRLRRGRGADRCPPWAVPAPLRAVRRRVAAPGRVCVGGEGCGPGLEESPRKRPEPVAACRDVHPEGGRREGSRDASPGTRRQPGAARAIAPSFTFQHHPCASVSTISGGVRTWGTEFALNGNNGLRGISETPAFPGSQPAFGSGCVFRSKVISDSGGK